MTAMLIEAALRALALAMAVGLGLRLLRVKNVPARKVVWSLVLVASAAMPLLMRWPSATGWRTPGWAVPIQFMDFVRPHLTAARPRPLAASALPSVDLAAGRENVEPSAADRSAASMVPAIQMAPDMALTASQSVAPAQTGPWGLPSPERLVAMAYLAVSGALLLRLLWGLAVALRLWMWAERFSPLVATEPHVRSSRAVASPVTIGSGIVLPADYPQWDRRKLRMVLAHEQAHVRGLDFYLQFLAGLYTAAFWFSPLGWWLRRTLSTLGEAMGDRAGMEAAASRADYAQVVVEFAAAPRRRLPGVAMACSGNLSGRIDSLLNENLFRKSFAEGRRRAALAVLLVPAALFAATALIRVPGAAAQSVSSPQDVQAAPDSAPASAPAPKSPPESAAPPIRTTAPVAPARMAPPPPPDVISIPPIHVPAVPPIHVPAIPAIQVPSMPAINLPRLDLVVPVAPMVAVDAVANAILKNGLSLADHGPAAGALIGHGEVGLSGYDHQFSANGDSWAIVEGPNTRFQCSGRWNGDVPAEIERARRTAHGPIFWFMHNGKSYIVEDPATVARIRALYIPMEVLGRQQEALGRQQQELGRKQEDLARAQQAVSVRMPDLSKEMASLDAALADLKAEEGHELTQEKLAQMQAKLAEMQARIGELEGEAGAKQGEFGARQRILGEAQGRLGAEQGRLGMEQERFAGRASKEVESIIDQCLHNGKALPLH